MMYGLTKNEIICALGRISSAVYSMEKMMDAFDNPRSIPTPIVKSLRGLIEVSEGVLEELSEGLPDENSDYPDDY